MKKCVVLLILVSFCIILLPGITEAAGTTSSSSVPWEDPLKKIADSLTGNVAFSLALLMIVAGFCGIAFVGAEIGGWIRWVAMAAIAAGTLGAAPKILNLFGFSATMIM